MFQLLGALIAVRIFSKIFAVIFKNKKSSQKILFSHIIFVLFATIAGGYGFADGGPPKFYHSFLVYIIPSLLSLAYDFWREVRKIKIGTV